MYLGIDIGGTTTKMGLVDASGTFLSENHFSTNGPESRAI